jgi:uncharacterized protein (UPF0332 family)
MNYSTSKHKQLLGWFNKNFILTNKISKDIGKIYYHAYENRQSGDYDDMIVFNKQDVLIHYDDMLMLSSEIEKLILKAD